MRSALDYHDATKHSFESIRSVPHFLDWDNQPLPFKLYRHLEPIGLPKDLAESGVPTLEALAGGSVAGEERIPTLEQLARLLYFSAGITKVKTYPGGQILFRAASCTGALYHIELYLACGDLPGLDAGLYHFGPSDFALRRLRAGDWRGVLTQAAGQEPFLARAPAVLLFTTTFWRNAWKYRARAYRHAFWDSGTILAHLLVMANVLHLPARIVLGFADEPVNRLLGVDPAREVTLGLVPVGQVREAIPPPPGPITALDLATVPLSKNEVDYPEIRAMHNASALENARAASEWRAAALEARPPEDASALEPLLHRAKDKPPGKPIEAVIRARGSTRQFSRRPITFADLSTILAHAATPIPADFLSAPEAYSNDLYLIANDVEALSSGKYFLHRKRAALEPLELGDFRRQARYLDLEQDLAGDASVNVYTLVELSSVLRRLGNRGYRAAQLEGGILGGRIYLAAYALGLGATGLTFYDDDVTAFFSPHASGKSVMFLAAVGRSAKRRVMWER